VRRKPAKARRRSAKATASDQSDQTMLPLQASDQTLSLLPMEIQVADRFTAEGFEWEVVTHPASFHGGKSLRARVQRPGLPESEREITWPAHVRIEIRRTR
jgi:hypothetical protein